MFSCEYCKVFKNTAEKVFSLFRRLCIHTYFQKELAYEKESIKKLRDFNTNVDLVRNL